MPLQRSYGSGLKSVQEFLPGTQVDGTSTQTNPMDSITTQMAAMSLDAEPMDWEPTPLPNLESIEEYEYADSDSESDSESDSDLDLDNDYNYDGVTTIEQYLRLLEQMDRMTLATPSPPVAPPAPRKHPRSSDDVDRQTPAKRRRLDFDTCN